LSSRTELGTRSYLADKHKRRRRERYMGSDFEAQQQQLD
jgi:hypothetical protein